jgi:hypothetical protein
VPVSETLCVGLVAVSVMVRVPVRAFACRGVNATLMEQLVAGVSTNVAGHPLLVIEKFPLTVTLLIVIFALPVLVTVTDCVELVVFTTCGMNATLAGDTAIVLVSVTPVPDIATVGAAPGALSLMVSVPLAWPAAVGVKVIETVQVLPEGPGGKVEGLIGHAFDATKTPLDETMLEIVTGELPVLVRVTVCGFG